MDVIERDTPFTGRVRENLQSIGIVWCTDGLAANACDDPADWVANIERWYSERNPDKPKRTPYHFYVGQDGSTHEGLGWSAYSPWHDPDFLGKNTDEPHDGSNSIVVIYLGAGENFTPAAQEAAYDLSQEHAAKYSRRRRDMLLSQVNTNSKSGGSEVPNSLASWVRIGQPLERQHPELDGPRPLVEVLSPEAMLADYLSFMDMDQLRAILDEGEVEYPVRARKSTLVKLVVSHNLVETVDV